MFKFLAANQDYKTSSEEEYVILGNDAIVKCKIPSFVADFVSVVSWHDSDDKSYFTAKDYGTDSNKKGKICFFEQFLEIWDA